MDDAATRRGAAPRRAAGRSAAVAAHRVSVVFDATDATPLVARRFAAATLRFLDTEVDTDDLALLLSEVVANAAEASDESIEVSLRTSTAGSLRVEVCDEGHGTPELQEPSPDQVAGRGLLIVDRVASRWGVERYRPGKVVWFEMEPASAAGDHGQVCPLPGMGTSGASATSRS